MIKKLTLFSALFVLFSFSIHKEKKFIPPGTVAITEEFFVDEAEISNLSWLEYEYWTAQKFGKTSQEYLATLPDTLVWRKVGSYNEPYVKYYYRHKAYRDFPVVGISYEQALAFCKWRTERVKELYAIRYKKELNIEYTLPSKEEWEFVSTCGSGVLSHDGRDEKGRATLNCARNSNDTLLIDKRPDNGKYPDVTTQVYAYSKNYFGLFNTLGNVAEMVLEKGICKGGSWKSPLSECRAGSDIPYTQPESWLGFRCVCKLQQPIH